MTGCFKYMGVCVDAFGNSCKVIVSFDPPELQDAQLNKSYIAIIKN